MYIYVKIQVNWLRTPFMASRDAYIVSPWGLSQITLFNVAVLHLHLGTNESKVPCLHRLARGSNLWPWEHEFGALLLSYMYVCLHIVLWGSNMNLTSTKVMMAVFHKNKSYKITFTASRGISHWKVKFQFVAKRLLTSMHGIQNVQVTMQTISRRYSNIE